MQQQDKKTGRAPLWYKLLLFTAVLVCAVCILYSVRSIAAMSGAGLLQGDEGGRQIAPLALTEDAGAAYLAETVFVGDSNTVRLGLSGVMEESRCIGLEGAGIAAVLYEDFAQLEGMACGVAEALAAIQPARIVMTFGTNDIGGAGGEDFIAGYREAIGLLQEAVPGANIIVNAIPPVARTTIYVKITPELVAQYNEALLAMCREDGVAFLDSTEVLADEDGYALAGYTIEDGLHLSETGLAVFVEYVCRHAYL